MIDVDPRRPRVLERFGFDEPLFETLRARVAAGELSPESNVVRGTIEPPRADDLTPLPARATPVRGGAAAGLDALRRGEVAQIVLAGGMATRFGGVVKAVLAGGRRQELPRGEARADRDARARARRRVPIALMTSFATDEAIREHIEERGLGEPLVFNQFVSLRLEPSGELFRDAAGRASLYAPGHGDLFQATAPLRHARRPARARRPRRDDLQRRQPRRARRSRVVGAHLLAGRPLTCEVARKEGDMGGAPVRVDGKLQLVEGPRFPPSFDQDLVPVFNTNTALFDLDALDEDYDLTWLYVLKDVDGRRPCSSSGCTTRSPPSSRRSISRYRVEDRGAVPPDQDARRSRASSGRPARAPRSATDLTRSRHEDVAGCARSVGGAGARPRSAGALRDLRRAGRPLCATCRRR